MINFQFQCVKHLMFPWLLTSSSHHVRGSPDQPIYDEKTLYPEKNDAGKKSMVAMLTMVAMVELAAHMCRSILYVIVFIIVLCQRWCGVDDCVVLDVEGAGLWNFEAPLPPAAAASRTISSCPYDGNVLTSGSHMVHWSMWSVIFPAPLRRPGSHRSPYPHKKTFFLPKRISELVDICSYLALLLDEVFSWISIAKKEM